MCIRSMLATVVCFVSLTSWAAAADVILNEYNAVSGNNELDGGDGADQFFGLIEGNGGNWFELVVVGDHVDMRGWQLAWTEDDDVTPGVPAAGVITLSEDLIWSDLRAGSIVTFIETADADGKGINTSTDVSYNPLEGDWTLLVSTRQEAAKPSGALATTTTNDGAAGDFSVGRDDWVLTISNRDGVNVFGPVGEGASWPGGGINNEEGGSLEGPVAPAGQSVTLEMWQAVTPTSPFYDDTGSTSFGLPNADYDSITKLFTTIQDLSPLRALVEPAYGSGDFDGDGQLTAADIDALTTAVRTQSTDLTYDVNLDGVVNAADRDAWVVGVKKTYFGDANLDGEFSSADFVSVFTTGEYEDAIAGNSTWSTGDWNGDGDFTTSDFVTAFQGGGYEQGPRGAVAAVPEPASSVLALLSLCGMLSVRRRRCR